MDLWEGVDEETLALEAVELVADEAGEGAVRGRSLKDESAVRGDRDIEAVWTGHIKHVCGGAKKELAPAGRGKEDPTGQGQRPGGTTPLARRQANRDLYHTDHVCGELQSRRGAERVTHVGDWGAER